MNFHVTTYAKHSLKSSNNCNLIFQQCVIFDQRFYKDSGIFSLEGILERVEGWTEEGGLGRCCDIEEGRQNTAPENIVSVIILLVSLVCSCSNMAEE